MKKHKSKPKEYKKTQYKHFAEDLLLISNKHESFKSVYQQVSKILKRYGKNSYEFSKLYLKTYKMNREQLSIIPSLFGSVTTGLLTTAAYESIKTNNIIVGIIVGTFGIVLGTGVTVLLTLRRNKRTQIKFVNSSNMDAVITTLENFVYNIETNIMSSK